MATSTLRKTVLVTFEPDCPCGFVEIVADGHDWLCHEELCPYIAGDIVDEGEYECDEDWSEGDPNRCVCCGTTERMGKQRDALGTLIPMCFICQQYN